jgi:hypothetical protein
MNRSIRFAASCCVFVALGGCADVEVEDSEDAVTAFAIKLEGTSPSVAVNDSPKLTSGAKGALSCKERFEIDGRVRIGCERGSEHLELIHADGKVRLVYRASGRSSDKRVFYSCSPSGSRPDGLPAKLACKLAKLRDRGGGLVSPFDSTVPGIGIPNTHAVGKSGSLFRGMAPRSDADFNQLIAEKIAAVLVFKNQTGNGHDVADEMAELEGLGLASADVVNVPFKWKEMGTFAESCQQTLTALKFMKARLAAKKKTFFHCTVGEDRTGFLAAVHRLVTEKDLDPALAWDGEMCERGYGAGNPLKPAFVVGTLSGSIRPLYRKMAWLVANGKLTSSLNTSVCSKDPESDPSFASTALLLDRLSCGTSTRFEP